MRNTKGQPPIHSKIGNSHDSVILQQRDRDLFMELALVKLADGSQIMTMVGFGSVRRTNDRLHRLVNAGLLRRCFVGTVAGGKRAVYFLSSRSAAVVGAKAPAISFGKDQLVTADQFISHQLQLTTIYLACKYRPHPDSIAFHRWLAFSKPLSETVRLIPDGYCELQTRTGLRCLFIEVDLGNESQRIWQQKVQMYLQLAVSGEFSRLFSQPQFRVLVIANSQRRLLGIRRTIAAVTDKIFWLTTANALLDHGLHEATWLRPVGDNPICLFQHSTAPL